MQGRARDGVHYLLIRHVADRRCDEPGCTEFVCKAGTLSDVVDHAGKPVAYAEVQGKSLLGFFVSCRRGHQNLLLFPHDVWLEPSPPGEHLYPSSSQAPAVLVLAKDPAVLGGAATIARTRIPVWIIASYIKQGAATPESLTSAEMYPHLSQIQIDAALRYLRDHAEEIEAEIARQASATAVYSQQAE